MSTALEIGLRLTHLMPDEIVTGDNVVREIKRIRLPIHCDYAH